MTKILKDSGKRRSFSSGAVRDTVEGKGSFVLVSHFGVRGIALQMERGAKKYSARNWENGMPLSAFLDSAERHLSLFKAGFDDEPHLDAALWNMQCLAEGLERIRRGLWPKSFDDLPKTYAGMNPED